MKRISFVLVLLSLATGMAHAGQFESTLGYTASVPSNWLVLTREEARKNPDLFEGLVVQGVNRDLMDSVRQRIVEGKVDMLFRKSGTGSAFADNINVFKQIQPTPSSDKDLKELCTILPGELAKAYNRQVSVYRCEYAFVNGLKAVYLEYDGVVPHTRSMQFFIPRSESVSLVVTATSSEATLAEVEKEFSEMIASLRHN